MAIGSDGRSGALPALIVGLCVLLGLSAAGYLIGRGVMPDYVVDQKQSDLLAGVDTIHEAALAWVRQELKP